MPCADDLSVAMRVVEAQLTAVARREDALARGARRATVRGRLEHHFSGFAYACGLLRETKLLP